MMFTSCGWFFDDVAGIEPTQILRYARQAMSIYETLTGKELESWFVESWMGHKHLTRQLAEPWAFGHGFKVSRQPDWCLV